MSDSSNAPSDTVSVNRRPTTVRIGVQLWPGGTPDYRTWRQAVLRAEELGADAIFGYDHFHKPFVDIIDGAPRLHDEQPDVNNFEGWAGFGVVGRDHQQGRNRLVGQRHSLPEPGPRRGHGADDRSHQRRATYPWPRRRLVREGLQRLPI